MGDLGVPVVSLVYRLLGNFTSLIIVYAVLAMAMAGIATPLPRQLADAAIAQCDAAD